MKKVIAIAVAIAVCGLYWYGCQKKATSPAEETPEMTEPAAPPPPPPPPGAEPTEGGAEEAQ